MVGVRGVLSAPSSRDGLDGPTPESIRYHCQDVERRPASGDHGTLPGRGAIVILAVSRFKVGNGMEADVRAAFLARPRLVDDAPGFLGFEVFTDAEEPSTFYLVTRWTDRDAFERWHHSDAHRQSHGGIPRGLKLDARQTRLVCLTRIDATDPAGRGEEAVVDRAPFLARALREAWSTYSLTATRDGVIQVANRAFARRSGCEPEALEGTPVWQILTGSDGDLLRARVEEQSGEAGEALLLNFMDREGYPYTISCRVDVHGSGFTLLGEPSSRHEGVPEQLYDLNNRLTVLARENARRGREVEQARAQLAATLEQLETTYWHLKKIQEVLPICMRCHQVKTGDHQWQDVVDYLKAHAPFISHGYCPACLPEILKEFEITEPLDLSSERSGS